MSDSFVTSQPMKAAFGPSCSAVSRPKLGWMSAITTLAPWLMNFVAVSFPMPLAAPVINATLPSSFLCRKHIVLSWKNFASCKLNQTSMEILMVFSPLNAFEGLQRKCSL